ncbi:MAG TPA: ATP-binding protein [Campylobacterales bacterium]|nr:ATP-binding protein [Campylobacterales bacterium]
MNFVGREEELRILENAYKSKKSSFLAVYGRRRIGKTELINHFLTQKDSFLFSVTGAYEATLEAHLSNFSDKLSSAFSSPSSSIKSWDEAFRALRDEISKMNIEKGTKVSIFIDELPWLAQVKDNGFKGALSLFWNDFASKRDDILLVVCGSATSWIIEHIIEDRGSLANRVTAIIHLQSFNLQESKAFLLAHGYKNISTKDLAEYYMIFGGVAHYLSLLNPKKSLIQNIQEIFFSQHGQLRTEYTRLFRSLFENYHIHELIIEKLVKRWSGMSVSELKKSKKLSSSSALNRALEELEASGFIVKHFKYGQKKRDALYRVKDPFLFFFTKWVEGTSLSELFQNKKYFMSIYQSQKYKIWLGYAFENLCHNHILELKDALGVGAVHTTSHYWKYVPKNKDEQGVQIDLLLVRADGVVNIVECKYTNKVFVIDKKYSDVLENKVSVFLEQSKYAHSVSVVMLTLNGVMPNEYADNLGDDILLGDMLK